MSRWTPPSTLPADVENRCRARMRLAPVCTGSTFFRSYFVRPALEFGLQGGPMNQSILTINGLDISLGMATAAFAAAVLALLVIIAAISVRAFRQREQETTRQMRQGEAMESRVSELSRLQAEAIGRL